MAQNNKRNYTQSFTYDKIGNMLTKVSTESKYPNVSVSALNYTNAYSYYTDAPHRAEIIGDMYYKYDNNGNVIEERQGGHREETVGGTFSYTYPDTDITRASQAFGWDRGGETEPDSTYRREYTWDEENRLTGTSDPSYTTVYTYDHEGERTVKYSDLGETLYFDSMWLEADTEGTGRLRCTKNIYIGETRIASKLNYKGEGTDYEDIHTYYYHTDHLSSSNVVTDADGEVYEHMEYTPKDAWASSKLACDQPYGEKWILDQNDNSKYDMIPYRFTSKEWDEETGLYYMSARYQNPEASRWVSSDPAGWGLVNPMDQNRDGKFQLRSGFSIVESMNPYSYCGDNPIRYNDPTGMESTGWGLKDYSLTFNKETESLDFSFSLKHISGKELSFSGNFKMSAPVLPTENGPRQSLSRDGREQGLVFPKAIPDGIWHITEVGYSENPIIGFFLRTDAEQELSLVEMVNGEWSETGETVIDSRYLLHELHGYTLGCGASEKEDLEANFELFETAFHLNGDILDVKIEGGDINE